MTQEDLERTFYYSCFENNSDSTILQVNAVNQSAIVHYALLLYQ